MGNEAPDKDILQEAFNHRKLSQLLQKKRPVSEQKKIKKIIHFNTTIEKKIELIEKTDKKYEQKVNEELKKAKERKELEKEKKEKKYTINYLIYLLKHYGKINRFGKSTKTLKGHLFPPHHTISENAIITSKTLIPSFISQINDLLWHIQEDGWKKLTKFQYNLCVTLYDFCDVYYKWSLNNITTAELRNLEKLFLSVTIDEISRKELRVAFDTYIDDANPFFENKESILNGLKNLVEIEEIKPSLPLIFLALRMVEHKRFITFGELKKILNIKPIEDRAFLSPQHVKRRIKNYIVLQKDYLKSQYDKLDFLQFLKKDIFEAKLIVNYDYAPLKDLFNAYYQIKLDVAKDENYLFDLLEYDFITFTKKITESFINTFNDLFEKEIKLVDFDKKEVKAKVLNYIFFDIFDNIKKYKRLFDELSLENPKQKLEYQKYLRVLNGTAEIPENIQPFLDLIEKFGKIFFDLGFSLYEYKKTDTDFKHLSTYQQLKFINDSDYQDKVIPYPLYRIKNVPLLNNKKVKDIIFTITKISFNIALLYKEQTLFELLEQEKFIREEILKTKETLNRIN